MKEPHLDVDEVTRLHQCVGDIVLLSIIDDEWWWRSPGITFCLLTRLQHPIKDTGHQHHDMRGSRVQDALRCKTSLLNSQN
jgi:hypothetical protein